MLDINYIKENIDIVRKAINQKHSHADLDQLLSIDEKKRELVRKIDELREQRNIAAKNKNIEQGKKIKETLAILEPQLKEIEKKFFDLMILIPNIPLDNVPEGEDESENKVIRKWGEIKEFSFTPKSHIDLGESLDLINTSKAAEVTGSRFAYLLNQAVILEFAIISYTFSVLQDTQILKSIAQKIDPNISINPFIPVLPPVMIKPDVYIKMGRLDQFQAEDRYYLPKDDLYLIGSAEHTLGPLHMNEVISEDRLPLRYIGFSTSFRREAGSYGKDIQGILRMHQFDKIELESFCLPENSKKEQDFIVAIQEYLVQSLNLPYHVVEICTGDMGGPDARQIDIETWIPSQNKYRETHTSDLMTDYQARRLNTKVKRKDGKVEFVHTNDATAFALGRILIAIFENYQQEDGCIFIPDVLKPFVNFTKISPK